MIDLAAFICGLKTQLTTGRVWVSLDGPDVQVRWFPVGRKQPLHGDAYLDFFVDEFTLDRAISTNALGKSIGEKIRLERMALTKGKTT